jgi:hypothetical protein
MSEFRPERRRVQVAAVAALLLLILLGVFIGGVLQPPAARAQPRVCGPLENLANWVEPPQPKGQITFTVRSGAGARIVIFADPGARMVDLNAVLDKASTDYFPYKLDSVELRIRSNNDSLRE